MSKHRRNNKPKLSLFDKRFREVTRSDATIKIIQSARRQGKTTFIVKDALRKAFLKPCQKIIICSANSAMVEITFSRIVSQLKGITYTLRRNYLKFANGSELRVFSARGESEWLGQQADFLYVDDAECMRDRCWEHILPTMREQGNLLITITPRPNVLSAYPALERLYNRAESTPNSFFHWPIVGKERKDLEAQFYNSDYTLGARGLVGSDFSFIGFDPILIA
jgi:predicted AAA+ superfamily ATPase